MFAGLAIEWQKPWHAETQNTVFNTCAAFGEKKNHDPQIIKSYFNGVKSELALNVQLDGQMKKKSS